MKTISLVLVVILIIQWTIALSAQVNNRCTLNKNDLSLANSCPTYEKPYQYCSLESGQLKGSCQDKTSIPFDKTTKFSTNVITAETQYCANGFRYMGSTGSTPLIATNKNCQHISMIGCSVPNAEASNNGGASRTCFRNSVFQADGANNQKCTRNQNNVGIVQLGDICDIVKDGTRQKCGHNLVCTTNNYCRKRNDIGGTCGTQFDTCLAGLTCHKWRCIPSYSLPHGASCDKSLLGSDTENIACQTGYCGDSFTCEHTETQAPCFKNEDCSGHTRSVCIGADPATGKKGTCSAKYQLARSRYYQCVYRTCNRESSAGYPEEEAQACLTTGTANNEYCSKDYARYMCSKYCPIDSDRRLSGLHAGESWIENGEIPFKFDCEKLTVSRLTNQDCSISSFFTNCEAFKDYPSAANSLLSYNPILALSLVALIAMALMF